MPDLIGVRDEVNLGVLLAVEKSGLFVVEIGNNLIVLVVVEKGYISSDNFRVGVEPRPYFCAK